MSLNTTSTSRAFPGRPRPGVCRTDGPPADVVAWRHCRLLEAGFPEPLATRLSRARVDVHALLQLVDRGCPPELAARILGPDEWSA